MRNMLEALIARYLGLTFVSDAQQAADLGYVHPGDDRRIGGDLGRELATVQREFSFKSALSPATAVRRFGRTIVEVGQSTERPGRGFIAIAVRRSDGKWDTVRFGWLFDPFWGDERTLGYNPEPETVGGYIPDVRIKFRSSNPFIDIPESWL